MKIEVEALGWRVAGVDVLTGITAVVEPRTMTALVGPNGSGKTTLLHLIAGLRRPTSGTVLLDGTSLSDLPARRRARLLALLEQHPETNLDVTVAQVVALGRLPHIGRWPGARDPGAARVAEAMEAAEVTGLARRRWASLSGGERQRAHLARALAQEPEVLLLDEPTNHLDLRHQIALLRTVAGLGLTTLVVLHDLDLAAAFCSRILVLSRGRLVADGTTTDVLDTKLIGDIFGVRATVHHDDRLRVLWHLPGVIP